MRFSFTPALLCVIQAISAIPLDSQTLAIHSKDTWASTRPDIIFSQRSEAPTLSPTSQVKGRTFNRFVQIWFENSDFDIAWNDSSFTWLREQGITLNNYWALMHVSRPNYVAAVAGRTYFLLYIWWDFLLGWSWVPKRKKTITHLLDHKNISWGSYQEGLPYSGFRGERYMDPVTGASSYERKHNPLMNFKSVANSPESRAKVKNLTMFEQDLAENKLPQWMFITPDMQNSGHDTSITHAGTWMKEFLEPLLTNPNFMNNTLIIITFDESSIRWTLKALLSHFFRNRVHTVILGDAVPQNLRNTSNNHYYSHYSALTTVERNWDLGDLGRNDKAPGKAMPFF